jgi:hypothetical protein
MIHTASAALALSALLVLAGLNAAGTAPQAQSGTSPMMNCPTLMKNVDFAIENTKDGISLTFTTSVAANVADLRRHVENMTKMQNQSAGRGMMAERTIPFTAKVEEAPNGARLTLTPSDPARLEEFRSRVREHAEAMKQGDCAMMHGMMMGGMRGMMEGMRGRGSGGK